MEGRGETFPNRACLTQATWRARQRLRGLLLHPMSQGQRETTRTHIAQMQSCLNHLKKAGLGGKPFSQTAMCYELQ